ncbi:MAG: hypothetical protein A2X28_04095 [Elusimicrobia bacterium GWA2_56_46]|nr:MAG: hypothetical protein A2X28_04095 [Elusimicrobia bacterium GWA2_56_46]OGR56059.1 MAG: hypothetical protein A2X39_07515 [Elusimicrobia bacterium GWC2_56_31]HBB67924.1 hypothetical protein [Elusimicrobiota bacterium]HBW22891.1 hypothetical protein [Elusimicrobiota bacterium]
MKKACLAAAALVLCLGCPAVAGEFKSADGALAVDFPSGWKSVKSDDPSVVLKLEKGKSFFEFSRLDSDLSDYYLKARVKEHVDSLRGKGNTLSGEIRPAAIRGVSTAYYTAYESMGAQGYMAFFTYGETSYAVSARGLDDGDFRGIIAAIRKPGEKIVRPRPQKIKAAGKKRPAPEESRVQIFKEEEPIMSVEAILASTPAAGSGAARVEESTRVLSQAGESAALSTGEQALRRTRDFLAGELENSAAKTPYLPRRPLSLYIWIVAAALWTAGAFLARGRAEKCGNPRLSPPPKEVPPDFFFPFIISRKSTVKDCSYSVLTRQKQRLLATFDFEHQIYVAGSVYACVFFHVYWSLLAFLGRGDLVSRVLLALPGGRLWASAPELLFAAPFIAGLVIYFKKGQVLRLFDAHLNLLMETGKGASYCLIRDGQGKEIARVAEKGGAAGRAWDFVDVDDQVVFTIKDDCPRLRVFRKLFGNLGGALRTRYCIFAAERRAGFVFLDPSSADRFQIHLDFDFARLAPPAQMLACILYIISRENDPAYPWPV